VRRREPHQLGQRADRDGAPLRAGCRFALLHGAIDGTVEACHASTGRCMTTCSARTRCPASVLTPRSTERQRRRQPADRSPRERSSRAASRAAERSLERNFEEVGKVACIVRRCPTVDSAARALHSTSSLSKEKLSWRRRRQHARRPAKRRSPARRRRPSTGGPSVKNMGRSRLRPSKLGSGNLDPVGSRLGAPQRITSV